MRVLDIVLGLGAIGAAVVAAKLIADAAKPKTTTTTASLPPVDSSGKSAVSATSTSTPRPPLVDLSDGKPPVPVFNPAGDCTGDMATTQACWCWGAGFGSSECKDFDYSMLDQSTS